MDTNRKLLKWEEEACRLRYDENLLREQIGKKLGRTFNEVKYAFSKPNVKRYIQKEVLPDLWRKEIADLEVKLKNRESLVHAYVVYLKEELDVKSCLWVGPGKRVFANTARSNLRNFRALDRIGQAWGLFDPSHAERNVRRAVLKYGAKLRQRLELLKEKLRAVERTEGPELEKT